MTEEEIKGVAEDFARSNKNKIAKRATDVKIFPPDEFPVSVFMAGSPGAGKTESSINLIEKLTKDKNSVLRIDPDELRKEFSDYNGSNSSLFISATSIIADRIQDIATHNRQSFIFDGTLANLKRSRDNIKRSIDKNRFVQIVYVYQDPLQAWNFVKAREIKDGRKIPKDAFIEQYFVARENVNLLKKEFGEKIKLDVVVKNIDGTDFSYHENISVVDGYVPEKYTRDDLRGIIN